MMEQLNFHNNERGESNRGRFCARCESNPAFKPIAQRESRHPQAHQKFFVRHATA